MYFTHFTAEDNENMISHRLKAFHKFHAALKYDTCNS